MQLSATARGWCLGGGAAQDRIGGPQHRHVPLAAGAAGISKSLSCSSSSLSSLHSLACSLATSSATSRACCPLCASFFVCRRPRLVVPAGRAWAASVALIALAPLPRRAVGAHPKRCASLEPRALDVDEVVCAPPLRPADAALGCSGDVVSVEHAAEASIRSESRMSYSSDSELVPPPSSIACCSGPPAAPTDARGNCDANAAVAVRGGLFSP